MTADWMGLGLAVWIGACLGWAACSLWTARWLDALRERQRRELEDLMKDIEPVETPFMKAARDRAKGRTPPLP